MTTDPSAATSATPPNVAALVDAIDARARQAGNEGASEVVQRMLGSVTEVLVAIQDRLDHVEDLLSGEAGSGGGENAVAEAVTAGLAAFNTRLGRLEEAFVQAVDESGSGTQAVVDEVRTVVVRALEESVPGGKGEAFASALDPETREALVRVESTLERLTSAREERPAQEVIGLALTAMEERLDGLEQRLVLAVQRHAPPKAQADLSTLDLSDQLAPLYDRFDAAETRIASTLEGSSRDALNSSLAPVLDRLDGIERRLADVPKGTAGTTVEDAFELVQVRIAGLEQLVRGRQNERVDATPSMRAALAPVIERMDELDAAHRSATARHTEGLGRVDAGLAALPGRLTSLEERVWAVVSSLTEGADSGRIDPAVLARFEEAVERLERDESSARLVALVEERMSAGLRAVTERTDEVRRSLVELLKASSSSADDDGALDDIVASLRALHTASAEVPDAVSSAVMSRLAPMSDRLGGLDERLDAIEALVSPATADPTEALARLERALERVSGRVEDFAARPEPPPVAGAGGADTSALVEQVTGAVRREAELLTQRVAALAVGVEAARVLIEQHVQENENSIGRKAGEVTRRLAADFGIRTRRNGPGGRRDPRELGSG